MRIVKKEGENTINIESIVEEWIDDKTLRREDGNGLEAQLSFKILLKNVARQEDIHFQEGFKKNLEDDDQQEEDFDEKFDIIKNKTRIGDNL